MSTDGELAEPCNSGALIQALPLRRRLTFNGATTETDTDSYSRAGTRARAEQPSKVG
ncbi:hypothetical protein [Streptomyces sp. NPDC048425]|uniref:hypothetical protein n=1 Tax=Streptomyces sp. NPDC048425 TaxID=3365548 RepID=UPI0037235B50